MADEEQRIISCIDQIMPIISLPIFRVNVDLWLLGPAPADLWSNTLTSAIDSHIPTPAAWILENVCYTTENVQRPHGNGLAAFLPLAQLILIGG